MGSGLVTGVIVVIGTISGGCEICIIWASFTISSEVDVWVTMSKNKYLWQLTTGTIKQTDRGNKLKPPISEIQGFSTILLGPSKNLDMKK